MFYLHKPLHLRFFLLQIYSANENLLIRKLILDDSFWSFPPRPVHYYIEMLLLFTSKYRMIVRGRATLMV